MPVSDEELKLEMKEDNHIDIYASAVTETIMDSLSTSDRGNEQQSQANSNLGTICQKDSQKEPSGISEEANILVDAAIQDAYIELTKNQENQEANDSPHCIYPSENYSIPNIDWGTIADFKEAEFDGPELLNKFISTWEYDSSWLYCIDYLGVEEFEFDFRHRFRVRWSQPTANRPIPRATASVYFTIVLSKIKPKSYPIEVFYVFETFRLVHRPGESRFREKWLKDIIKSKMILFDSVKF